MTSHAPVRRVTVSTGFDAEYASFYLQGLRELQPSVRLRFAGLPFQGLPREPLGLRIGDDGPRVCIDSHDSHQLVPEWFAWADVYGKVNLDPSSRPATGAEKLCALGPGFGVRVWGPARSAAYAFATFMLDRSAGGGGARKHFSRWRRQYAYHPPEHEFVPGESDPTKLFFVSSLWPAAPMANELRRRFVAACVRVPGAEFEGGFAPFRHGFEVDVRPDMQTSRRYPAREFIAKLQRSAASFIVPGVHDCLTWRLGQSLALGKAIIATPLARAMPAPLEHGRNVHFVDGSEGAILDALQKICGDTTYRRSLEREARAYYDTYLAPKAVVGRLLAGV